MTAPAERSPGPLARYRRFLPLLGLLLLAWVLSRQDMGALSAAFARVSAAALGWAALLFGGNCLLKALRWQRMLVAQALPLPLRVALPAYLSAMFYGQVTLGRVGELYKAAALLERGVPLGTAISSSVYDRLLDLGLVTALAAGLSFAVVGDARTAATALGAVLLLSLSALVVLRARSLAQRPSVARMRAWLDARRGGQGLLALLAQVVSGLDPLLRPGFLLPALAWTLVSWVGYFGALFSLADGMGLGVSRTVLTACAALGALSALLPVTVSGVGARELIFMHVLGREGVASSDAIALSLAHLGVMTAVAIGLGSLGLWTRARQG